MTSTDQLEFDTAVAALKQVCVIAYPASPLARGLSGRSDKARLADKLIARMLLTASGLVRTCECDHPVGPIPAWIDITSVATNARSLLEAAEVLDYLALQDITTEEEEFRQNLFSLHQVTERRKVLDALNIPEGENPFGDLNWLAEFSRMALRKNSYFKGLNPGLQKELLKGKIAFFQVGSKPPASAGLSRTERDGLYKLFSNFIHSHPFAVQMRSHSRIWPDLQESHVLILAVGVAAKSLAWSFDGYLSLRRLGARLGRPARRTVQKVAAMSLPAIRLE